jgi:integrase
VIPEDPAAAVKGVQKEAAAAKKRAFTLDELRAVLDVADPEWKSMSLFGLYTGQRLADIATMRWSSVDLVKGEQFAPDRYHAASRSRRSGRRGAELDRAR